MALAAPLALATYSRLDSPMIMVSDSFSFSTILFKTVHSSDGDFAITATSKIVTYLFTALFKALKRSEIDSTMFTIQFGTRRLRDHFDRIVVTQ